MCWNSVVIWLPLAQHQLLQSLLKQQTIPQLLTASRYLWLTPLATTLNLRTYLERIPLAGHSADYRESSFHHQVGKFASLSSPHSAQNDTPHFCSWCCVAAPVTGPTTARVAGPAFVLAIQLLYRAPWHTPWSLTHRHSTKAQISGKLVEYYTSNSYFTAAPMAGILSSSQLWSNFLHSQTEERWNHWVVPGCIF